MKYVLFCLLLVLSGCASTMPHSFYDEGTGTKSEAVPAEPSCKDGHCWRTLDGSGFVGSNGELIPAQYPAPK